LDPLIHGNKQPAVPSLFFCFAFVLLGCILIGLWAHSALAREKTPCLINTELSEDQFLEETQKYLGIPYRRGGNTRKGMDCSGLIRQMYGNLFSLDLPHNAAAQKRFIKDVSREELKAGDLVFFGTSNKRINHIGAYLSDGKFIHASRKAGVTISSLSNSYWRKRFVSSGRINGLELSGSGKGFDAGENESPEEAVQWSLTALESETGSGLSSDISVNSLGNFNVKTFILMQELQSFRSTVFDSETIGKVIGESGQFTLRQGVRLSSDWALSNWLQVAPYWTYIIDRNQPEEEFTDMKHMGLSAEIAHPNLRWSISLAAQPSLYPFQSDQPSAWNTDFREMDLFFGYRYRISDTWKLSLFGSGSIGTEEAENSTSHSPYRNWLPTGVEEMGIHLDFSF
jgi:hypothetical protein